MTRQYHFHCCRHPNSIWWKEQHAKFCSVECFVPYNMTFYLSRKSQSPCWELKLRRPSWRWNCCSGSWTA